MLMFKLEMLEPKMEGATTQLWPVATNLGQKWATWAWLEEAESARKRRTSVKG